MKLPAIVLALALAACGQTGEKQDVPAAPAGPDPATLNIEIGRYGAMLSQVSDQTVERPGSAEPEVTETRDLARRLREAVWSYNIQRSQLCAKGLFTEVACGSAYEPVWIAEPNTVAPTLEEIQSRADALGAEVQTLWGAVCDDAKSRVPEEERMSVCPME
ncbi:MAG: hypothetical protein JNL81_11385 [Hyphomonadaceae bacterium]|nr:hypothetical protein [Hyphomonadaceae bacterium]